MNSFDQFEHRLAVALRSDADLSLGGFEPAQIARAAIADAGRHPARVQLGLRIPNMFTRFAVAAVIGLLAIGGSLYLLQRDQRAVGTPSSSPGLQSSPTPAPPSSPAARMTVGRGLHTATLLDDGRVLIAGGNATGGTALASAELYDPATRTFIATGSMTTPRGEHAATLLEDGRVLMVGGRDASESLLASAELYDPRTDTFSATGSMAEVRAFHTATLLLDGRVLVTGGGSTVAAALSAEIYDPQSGTFSSTEPMAFGGVLETATRLSDGRVLVAGGFGVSSTSDSCFAVAEIFDPTTGTFSPAASMTAPRCGHTATLLGDGRVLMTTGTSAWENPGRFQSSAEIFDPATGKFSATGSMAHAPAKQTAILLPDGRVLIAGGNQSGQRSLASAEIFDPTTGTFRPTGSMAAPRTLHATAILSDGRVLVTGGDTVGWNLVGPFLNSAEIYDPSSGTFNPAG